MVGSGDRNSSLCLLDYFESIVEDTVGYLYNLGFVPTLDKNRAMQSFLRGGGRKTLNPQPVMAPIPLPTTRVPAICNTGCVQTLLQDQVDILPTNRTLSTFVQ